MKAAIAILGALVVILLVMVVRSGRWAAFEASLKTQGASLAPMIVVAVLLAACVEVLVPRDTIARHLGDASGLRGILLAWVFGVITPGGGPIGLPLVASLARAGASLPVLLTYLLSMSTLSLLRLPLEWGVLGGRLAGIRYATSVVIPPVVGAVSMVILRFLRGSM
jgi:uncharacterized membrane protein YraQ (UPF0718 family)